MNKLKSMFKKDKDSKSESTPSYQSSGGTPSGSISTGGAAAAYSGGSSSGGAPTGAQSATGMSSVAAVPQQSSGASYGGGGAMPQQSSGMSSGGAPAQQAPTESAFPPNNAPSTGVENADHPQGVVMHTTLGDITIALFAEQTPRTCKNFATLAATGKYDNVIFHRIIPGFMIQGGDPEGSGRGGRSIYGAKFEDEFHPDLKHTGKGIMSMANSGPNTNGSQFFICLAATPHLDMKHTVFGQVADGMDVVDRLGAVRTGAQDRPVQEVKILRCDVF